MRKLVYIFSFLFLFTSCFDKYEDFKVKGDTELILPVAHGSFILGDLLNTFDEDSMFKSNVEDELIFSYRNNDLVSLNFGDILGIPYNVGLADELRILGKISLKDTIYNQYIPLGEIIEKLSFVPELASISEGSIDSFSPVRVGSEVSPFLSWNIDEFDFLTEGDIYSGNITVKLKNEFPVNCKVAFQFFDSEGTFIDQYLFGDQNPNGLMPYETDSFLIDMAGKKILAPLNYKISYLEFFGSSGAIDVQFSKGLNLFVQINNLKLDSGHFRSEKFKYISETKEVNISFIDSAKLSKVAFNSGILQIVIKKQFQPDGILTVHFPKLKENGLPVECVIPLTGDDFVAGDIDLTGKELTLSSSTEPFNIIEYYLVFENGTDEIIQLNSTDQVRFIIDLYKIIVSSIEGDFGQRELNFSRTGITLNPEIWDKLGGEVFGSEPVLTVYFSNPIGIPILYDFTIQATNRIGNSVKVDAIPYIMDYPISLEESPVLSEKLFTVENSNIMDFIKLPPNDTINFNVNLALNPDGEPSAGQLNFVDLDKPFNVGIGFEVPILLKGLFFKFDDTLSLSIGNINDIVEEAILTFRTHNEIPLQVDFSVIPFDTLLKQPTGDALLVTLLDAAPTDEFGNVTGITETENELILSPEDFSNLQKANSMVINASFLSPGEGTQPAKLRNEYGFDLKIILNVSPAL